VTIRREYELSCDGKPGDGPFDCPYRGPIFALSAAQAWREAREEGWITVVVPDGRKRKKIHLCPVHAKQRAEAKTRGICSVCLLVDLQVGVNGTIRRHARRAPDGSYIKWAPRCEGSGKPAKAA
jgi:hypothetical protein